MYKLLVLYSPPQSTSHFIEYYEKHHLPLAAKLPGLRASRYAFNVAAPNTPAPYFAVWEGEFDSAADMVAALQSPEGQAVTADVQNYATGGCTILHYPID